MQTKIAIAMIGLVVLIFYSIIMTLYVFFPKTLIRWADYFAIPIKEQELSTEIKQLFGKVYLQGKIRYARYTAVCLL